MYYRNRTLRNLSWVLTTIGALNWGFKGLVNFNLVEALFGERSFLSNVVYALVGVAGVYSLYHLVTKSTRRAAATGLGRIFGEVD